MTDHVAPAEAEPGRVDDRRDRELLGCALWALAALGWTGAMLVPWFRAGALGEVTPVEAAGALRTGLLGTWPGWGFAVLLLPALAWVLLVIAPARGRRALAVRLALWVPATAAGLALVVVMASVSAGTYGLGAGLVLASCVLGAGALCCSTVATPRGRALDE